MQKTKNKSNNLQIILIPVIALLLIGAAFYSFSVLKNAYTVFPDKVYDENFDTPRSRIHDLIGGGEISGYYDIWIRFECPDVVRLKETDWQQSASPSRAAQWWGIHHPEEVGTQDYQSLSCWTMQRHPNTVTVANGDLLYNRKLNRYWFRIWGRK